MWLNLTPEDDDFDNFNQHYLRKVNFPRVTAFFLPIVFRGIKQIIIYIYPYDNSNRSRAPSNIHRTWLSQLWIHRSWQCFHTSFISSIQLVSLSLSLKFLFKIFEFYLVSHLSFRNYNLNSVDSFFREYLISRFNCISTKSRWYEIASLKYSS